MTELVARIQIGGAGVRMLGMFERATWPLRRLTWWLEEKVFWPAADALRGRGEHAAPIEIEAERSSRRPDLRIAFATVGAAAVIGIGIAALLASTGGSDSTATRASLQSATFESSAPAIADTTQQAAKPHTLHGAAPSFNSASKVTKAEAQANLQAAGDKAQTDSTSPTAATNAKPSAIPAGAAGGAAPLRIAQDFSGAFVLYEVGRTNAKVKQTFAKTATPAVAKALDARPPRQPGSVKVPTAKVQNIVLSAPEDKGRLIEASVSLLRLGALSELRLSLSLRHGKWAVSEVRG
jgi:hypothetical protein